MNNWQVFNVVSSAMRLAGGWEEDVVDGPSPASSMQPLPVSVPKCYMWNLMWTWSAKVRVSSYTQTPYPCQATAPISLCAVLTKTSFSELNIGS